ncbi:MAG: glycosyltransferase family 4 protein [Chlamydiia bacterium]
MTAITVLKSTIAHLGGLEKYTMRLANAFVDQGQRVVLLTTGDTKQIDRLKNIEVHSHRFKSRLSVNKITEFDRYCSALLQQQPSEIIFGLDRNRDQTHIRAGNGVHAAYLDQRKKTEGLLKKISFYFNPLHKLLLSIEKESFENPKLQTLFTNSRMVRNEILSYYNVDEKKIQVIHNGVEWKEMQTPFEAAFDLKPLYCRELGLNPQDYQLLFIGNNFVRKGLMELLHSLSALLKHDFHLSIVGTDKHTLFFQNETQRLGLGRKVTFFGQRRDIIKFYQIADCLTIPSHYDPFANVTLEALAMGLYVISSRQNGASEVLLPDSGSILQDLHDTDCLIGAIQKAFQHPKKLPQSTLIRSGVQHLDFSRQLSLMVEKTLSK